MTDELRRKLQLFELQMLKDIKKVCLDNNIRYFLYSGTCLGAVRHKGFIPWDDDIDIAMPVPDYERFLQIAQNALGSDYFVQNQDTEPSYRFAYTKIRRNHTTMISPWLRNVEINHGIWIDVNPLIYTDGGMDFKIRKNLITFSNVLCSDGENYRLGKRWMFQQKKYCAGLIYLLTRLLPYYLRRKLAASIRRKLMHAPEKPYLSGVWGSISSKVPASAFDGDPVYLPFEDDVFPVPPDYDVALTGWYGDYMTCPPEGERGTIHYDLLIDFEHGWEELDHSQNESDS